MAETPAPAEAQAAAKTPAATTPETTPAANAAPTKKPKNRKNTPAAPAATETAQALTTPPAPPRDPDPMHDPFHRNVVDPTVVNDAVPQRPSENLDPESEYKNIEEHIEAVRSGRWETDQREQHLEQRYGRGLWARWRAWLGGENVGTIFGRQTGDIRIEQNAQGESVAHHDYLNDFLRRTAHVAINTAETAGIAAGISLLTGGAGSGLGLGLVGSALGRSISEAYRGFSANERDLREKLEIARAQYYAKARWLADRIPAASPVNRDQMSSEQYSQHMELRNKAIRDLVNFTLASEQHGIDLQRREGGAYYYQTRYFGVPNLPSSDPGEAQQSAQPLQPGRRNQGTEVYQPSAMTPTAETIDQLEKEYMALVTKAQKTEEYIALAMGLGGGVVSLIGNIKAKAAEKTAALLHGQAVQLKIHGTGHLVQQVSDPVKNAWHLASNYVYHYAGDVAQGDTVVAPIKGFISHELGESWANISSAISSAARWEMVPRAAGFFVGLGTRFAHRQIEIRNAEKGFEKKRGIMMNKQEVLRRRLQPELRGVQLADAFRDRYRVVPETGQVWMFGDSDSNMRRIKIDSFFTNSDQSIIRYHEVRPEGGDNYIREMPAETLLYAPIAECLDGELNNTGPNRRPTTQTGPTGPNPSGPQQPPQPQTPAAPGPVPPSPTGPPQPPVPPQNPERTPGAPTFQLSDTERDNLRAIMASFRAGSTLLVPMIRQLQVAVAEIGNNHIDELAAIQDTNQQGDIFNENGLVVRLHDITERLGRRMAHLSTSVDGGMPIIEDLELPTEPTNPDLPPVPGVEQRTLEQLQRTAEAFEIPLDQLSTVSPEAATAFAASVRQIVSENRAVLDQLGDEEDHEIAAWPEDNPTSRIVAHRHGGGGPLVIRFHTQYSPGERPVVIARSTEQFQPEYFDMTKDNTADPYTKYPESQVDLDQATGTSESETADAPEDLDRLMLEPEEASRFSDLCRSLVTDEASGKYINTPTLLDLHTFGSQIARKYSTQISKQAEGVLLVETDGVTLTARKDPDGPAILFRTRAPEADYDITERFPFSPEGFSAPENPEGDEPTAEISPDVIERRRTEVDKLRNYLLGEKSSSEGIDSNMALTMAAEIQETGPIGDDDIITRINTLWGDGAVDDPISRRAEDILDKEYKLRRQYQWGENK